MNEVHWSPSNEFALLHQWQFFMSREWNKIHFLVLIACKWSCVLSSIITRHQVSLLLHKLHMWPEMMYYSFLFHFFFSAVACLVEFRKKQSARPPQTSGNFHWSFYNTMLRINAFSFAADSILFLRPIFSRFFWNQSSKVR